MDSKTKSSEMARDSKTGSNLTSLYLFAYNLIQFLGWSYGLVTFVSYFVTKGTYIDVYYEVKTSLAVFQTLQLIEVVHSLVGIVRSNPFETFIQIMSRIIVVWGTLYPVVESRNAIGVPMLLTAWSLAEMTRYSYYALNLYNAVPYALTWLRYTLFIVLYPLGVSGELLTVTKAMPYIGEREMWSFSLPNFFNVSFSYNHFMIGFLLLYIPFFPKLYLHMLSQRKKILGPNVNICQKIK